MAGIDLYKKDGGSGFARWDSFINGLVRQGKIKRPESAKKPKTGNRKKPRKTNPATV